MRVTPLALPEILLIEPVVHGDERGFFLETYSESRYRSAGIVPGFVQDNLSSSRRGVLRGLHYQLPNAQGKLVQVVVGEVFDVAVDIRVGSPRFGRWVGELLSSDNRRQLWVPPGFAHGFVVTSEMAVLSYKCTAPYDRDAEHAIRWDDPAIGIEWPAAASTLSARDAHAPTLADAPVTELPRFGEY